MKVCTYNIRCDTKEDQDWQWSQRKAYVVDLLTQIDADVFGVEEAISHQFRDLQNITEYDSFGIARDDGVNSGEYNAIFYRKSRFSLVDQGYFWLSKTPDEPSIFPGAACVRICVWVKLMDTVSNKRLLVASTHLDHVSEEARRFGLSLIIDRLQDKTQDTPFVLMGDFNMEPDDPALEAAKKTLKMGSEEVSGPIEGTYQEDQQYVPSKDPVFTKIDYIFVNTQFTVDSLTVNRTPSTEGRYPSDHFPVVAELAYQ